MQHKQKSTKKNDAIRIDSPKDCLFNSRFNSDKTLLI